MKLTREVVKEPDVVITMTVEEARALHEYLNSGSACVPEADDEVEFPQDLLENLDTVFCP